MLKLLPVNLDIHREEIYSERRWMNIRGKCMNASSQDHLKQIAHDTSRVFVFSVLERTVHSKHEWVQRNSFANVIWQNRKKWLRDAPTHHRDTEIAAKGKLENIGMFWLKEPKICSIFIQNHEHLDEKSFSTKPFWYSFLWGNEKLFCVAFECWCSCSNDDMSQ